MRLEIFKVGTHTSSNGITKDYTLDHLNQIVANHSEPTPIVVGHPKTNSPAFGWIKNLFVKDDSLFADASDIVPEFLELVKQKIYPNRSASFSTNEDGTLQLKHVGFLGGTLPAVKGLEAIQFNADEALETFEFTLSDTSELIPSAEVFTLSEIESNKFNSNSNNLKHETRNLQPLQYDNFAEELSSLKTNVHKITEFMESIQSPQGTVDLTGMQSKIDELAVKIDAAYFQKNIIERLQLDNLTPAIKNKILNLLRYFESLTFAEEKQSEILLDFQELADLIQPFQTEEILKKQDNVSPFSRGTEGGSEFSSMYVDKDSLKIYNDAIAIADKDNISFSEAVNKIISNNNNEV